MESLSGLELTNLISDPRKVCWFATSLKDLCVNQELPAADSQESSPTTLKVTVAEQ